MNNFSRTFSDNSFWKKLSKYALIAGAEVITMALKLYFSLLDPDTPIWARTAIIGALGYFICPIDAIPDYIPVIGYSDDAGVLAAAIAIVGIHIKEAHTKKAKETLKQWFG